MSVYSTTTTMPHTGWPSLPKVSIQDTDPDGDSMMADAPWNGGPPPSRFSTPQPGGMRQSKATPASQTVSIAPQSSANSLQVPARGANGLKLSAASQQFASTVGVNGEMRSGRSSRPSSTTRASSAPPATRGFDVSLPVSEPPTKDEETFLRTPPPCPTAVWGDSGVNPNVYLAAFGSLDLS